MVYSLKKDIQYTVSKQFRWWKNLMTYCPSAHCMCYNRLHVHDNDFWMHYQKRGDYHCSFRIYAHTESKRLVKSFVYLLLCVLITLCNNNHKGYKFSLNRCKSKHTVILQDWTILIQHAIQLLLYLIGRHFISWL